MTSASRTGTVFERFFPVLGLRVPLREGPWVLLAEIRRLQGETSYVNAFLGRIEARSLWEATTVLVLATASSEDQRYGPLKRYDNVLYEVIERNEANGSQAAWFVSNVITSPWADFHDRTTGIDELDRMAAEALKRRAIHFPPDYLMARFCRREQVRTLQASYYLNPAQKGLAPVPVVPSRWQDSDYAPRAIRRHPDKFAFYQDVTRWAETWWPKITAGFLEFHPEGF